MLDRSVFEAALDAVLEAKGTLTSRQIDAACCGTAADYRAKEKAARALDQAKVDLIKLVCNGRAPLTAADRAMAALSVPLVRA
jgi:hypothetical protein